MPLVVPVLRFFVVFLNVYETFKTLKPPPPSSRREGKPSTRALTQRKRDLKGCLAVWVIWCCYAAYERTFDRAVAIFLPFYGEIKSVFLLFLVLTRAKGAEPLFLHVLRPLLRPYAAVVDPMLELSRDLGDFFFALLQVPLDYILSSSWFPLSRAGELEEEFAESESTQDSQVDLRNATRASNRSNIPVVVNRSSTAQLSRVQSTRQGSLRGASDNQHSNGLPPTNDSAIPRTGGRHSVSASTISLPAYSEHPSHDPPQYSRTISRHNAHQIWYPPVSTSPTSSQEAPVSTVNPFETAPEYRSPEWRTYPAFPSAYPPTPLPASASLPSPTTTRSGSDHRLISDSAYPPIPEEEQGFDKMLERQREGRPGPMHSSSNNNKISPGVDSSQESFDTTQLPAEDTLPDDSMCSSETGLSEDDFGTSLRTPHRFPQAMPPSGYSSADSLNGALSTAENASSLGTNASSDSLSSGSSSIAGRKRTHRAFQGLARDTHATSQSRNATLRGKTTPFPIPHDPLHSSSSEDEHGSEAAGGDDSSTNVKRRRVLDPMKRRSTVRPVARETGSTRRAPLPSRSVNTGRAIATVSQRTSTGSVRINNSTIKGRKPTATLRQVTRSEPQGIAKTASTSSAQSGTLRRRPH